MLLHYAGEHVITIVNANADSHGGHGQGGGGGTILPSTSAKLDLLLVIDNSRGMADKQAVLAEAVPDLVERLVNPLCVDSGGNPSAQQPADPLAACPEPGTARENSPCGPDVGGAFKRPSKSE